MSDFVLILSLLYGLPFSDLALVSVCASEKPKNNTVKVDTYEVNFFFRKRIIFGFFYDNHR